MRRIDARFAATLAGLAALAIVPVVIFGSHWLFVSTTAAIFAIAAVGLGLVIAHVGLVSLGHAAFFGIGAYATAILSTRGFSPLLGIVVGLAAAAAYGTVVGPLALRSRGIGFVMVTLALGELAHVAAGQWVWLTGGDTGLSAVPRLPISADPRVRHVVIVVLLLVVLLACRWLLSTTLGRGIDAARQDEHKARALGYDVDRGRFVVFVISAAVTGLAGALFAHHTSFVSPTELSWLVSGELIVMVLLGGGRSLAGAVAGAVGLIFLEDAVTERTDLWSLVLGTVFAVVVLSGWLNRQRTRHERIDEPGVSEPEDEHVGAGGTT